MSYIKYFLVSLLVLLSSCSQPRDDNEIYLGTVSGPETELVEIAKEVALKQHGLKIKIIEFEDYAIPNIALADGSIDANMFQHLPYLELAKKYKGFDLVSIGETFVYPMGIYSGKHQDLSKLPNQAKISIPIDPSNGARALRLLAQANLITIPEVDDMELSPKVILTNPKQLKIIELDAAQLPRTLDDVDAAVINTNFAIPAGLTPSKDALFLETKDSPYANIIVVRAQEQDHEKFKKLVESLQSQAVQDKAKELFQGQAIPAWK